MSNLVHRQRRCARIVPLYGIAAWRAVRQRMGFRGLPHVRQNGLFLFIALGRMVTFCKEGGGMLLVWVLRARSYKARAEA